MTLDGNMAMAGPLPDLRNMPHLSSALFSGYFNGSIPGHFCQSRMSFLTLQDMPILQGTIPDCLFQSANTIISLRSTSLGGSIPDSLCSAELMGLEISDNTNLTGSLPECEQPFLINDSSSLQLIIAGNEKLEGTVPESYWCAPHMSHINISYNGNMDAMRIPICWWNVSFTRSLYMVALENNHFYGRFPRFVQMRSELYAYEHMCWQDRPTNWRRPRLPRRQPVHRTGARHAADIQFKPKARQSPRIRHSQQLLYGH